MTNDIQGDSRTQHISILSSFKANNMLTGETGEIPTVLSDHVLMND